MVYSVYSFPSSYVHEGMFTIYAGMKPEQAGEAVKLILEETDRLYGSITEKEFEDAREQLKGNYFLGLESASSRMSALGKSLLLLDEVVTPDEVVERIRAVTLEDVRELVRTHFDRDRMATAMVGRMARTNVTF